LLQGVGPKTAERLAALGVRTVGELQRADPELLSTRFGARHALSLHNRASFHDESPVETVRIAKSRSNEVTFPSDVIDPIRLETTLIELAGDLAAGLRARSRRARTIAVKVRLDDWTTVTRARTLDCFTDEEATITTTALALLRAYAPPRPVRLLGVRVASFEDEPRDVATPPARTQLALPL
jgi:DNA polymerase-4